MPKMYLVSCRKDFWSPTEFASTDEIRHIDLDDGNGSTVSTTAFVNAMAGKRLTVLIHGYNNERLDVLASYRAIDAQMRALGFLGGTTAPYDALVGFVWPGGALGVSFVFARERAGDSAPRLQRLIADLRGAGTRVDLNSHSLGAHVAFEALRPAGPAVIENAWNFASAVDNESIEKDERYYPASQRCTRFYVFHSKNDPVLRVWYRIGDFFDFDTALGYSGPEDPRAIIDSSKNVRVINCKEVVTSHGGYRSAGQVWSFMARELASPTQDQFVTLKKTPAMLAAEFAASGGLMPNRSASRRSPGRARSRRRSGR